MSNASGKTKKPKVDFKNVSKYYDTTDFENQAVPRVSMKKTSNAKISGDMNLRDYPAKAPQQKPGGGYGRAKDYIPFDSNDFKKKLDKVKKQKANVKTV